MRKEILSISIESDKAKVLSEATKVMKVPKSKVVSMMLEEGMFKLSNFINEKTRNHYISQYLEGKINEEVLFDVFPKEKAKQIIEGASIGKRAGKEVAKLLSGI